MSDNFRLIDRHTPYLLPPSLQDWLPETHLARFIVDIVDRLDLSALESQYRGGGKAPYHPAMLLSVLFYGYATGVFSSRKLEQSTYDSVAFRFITADQHPDHDTLASFRQRFLKAIEGLFVQVLVVAHTLGLLKLGNVSLDGTKIKANASKHKAMSWGYANRLEAQLRREVEQLLALAKQADAESAPDLDIPDELQRREDRLAAIAAAKAEITRRAQDRYKAEQAAYQAKLAKRRQTAEATGKAPKGRAPKPPEAGPTDQDQVNFTDPEARIMPSSDGFVQAYNAQAAVDTDTHLIVENHTTQQPNDVQQIAPTLAGLSALPAPLGKVPGLLADTGYFSEANVKHCTGHDITPYISDRRARHHPPLDTRLAPPPAPPDTDDALALMRQRMATPAGKAVYALRKSTVETVFGIIKSVLGFRQFRLRGQAATQGEWNLVCLAWNLKRMHALAA